MYEFTSVSVSICRKMKVVPWALYENEPHATKFVNAISAIPELPIHTYNNNDSV